MLILIQASRAGLLSILHSFYQPAVDYSSLLFVLIGVLLYFLYKPDKKSLGVDFNSMNKRIRLINIIGTAVVLILIVTSLIFFCRGNRKDILLELEGALVYPVFEELLFRGYLWDRFHEKYSEIKTFVIITLFFGLWHLGYRDVIGYRAGSKFPDINMNQIMFYKVQVGMAYGAVTGFIKIKMKNTYSCILIHSLFNIFAR
jgi:membrane protease YdiL (CAAX protease family)